jgi:hypothetical protein
MLRVIAEELLEKESINGEEFNCIVNNIIK